jgi:hypothetical protein
MASSAASPKELIPGYRLLSRLGQGGFGEVWKAEAPGGLLKAVKIIYGTIHGAADGYAPARQELKALERVKAVRHPFILSLERYDIVNGQLVIVTELADKNLWDRFNECRAQGLPGIPRDELLRQMEEAAEALDLMNIEYQLQHLDIKPQNLFLVYNHVKVADFGLVKDLEGMRTQMTSGMTAGYAPPETFGGLVSRYCDQYSLAIVYQELLTGRLPFDGTNPRQLMMQHVTAQPDLGPLPPGDREAVGRALAKKPEDRHPSCRAFVAALRGTATGSAHAIRVAPCSPAVASAEPAPLPQDETARVPGEAPGLTTLPTRPAPPAPDPVAPVSLAGEVEPAPPAERPEITGDGVLFPALVIGLGAVGREALRCLRKALSKRWGAEGPPHVRLLLLDADPDELCQATQGDADTALRPAETLALRLQRPSHYLKPGRERQALEKWLEPDLLCRLPRAQTTPNGWRVLGRLAFAGHSGLIASRLAAELGACTDGDRLAATAAQTGLGLRTNRPRVYIVCGLGGGTGGGMFLDVAYAARHQLRQMGYRRSEVLGLFLLPAVSQSGEKARATANAFAALTELSYFSAPGRVFSTGYLDGGRSVTDADPPFSRCILLPLPKGDEPASMPELASLTGEYLVRELTTPLARAADEERARRAASRAPAAARPGLVCQTFGAYWFAVPRRLLLQRVARRLCGRLVRNWRGADATGLAEAVRAWAAGQLARHALTPEELARAVDEEAARLLGRPAEDEIEAALAACAPGQADDLAGNPALAAQAITAVTRLVGAPATDRAPAPAALGEALEQVRSLLGTGSEERLAEMALRGLAEPRFRLLGVEEMVQQGLGDALAQEATAHRTEAEVLTRAADALYPRLAPQLAALQGGGFWGRGKRHRAATELLELLRRYGRGRWEILTRQTLGALYDDLQTNLQKYRRKVACCRGRIAQFLEGFGDSAGGDAGVDLGLGQYLLPAGCRTLSEAVERIVATLTREELAEIDGRVQELIAGAFEAQVHVCTAPANFFKELGEEVEREVAAFAAAPLGRAHAAEMYLEQRGQDDTAVGELAAAFAEAAPELAGPERAPGDELNVLAVPPGAEGEHFRRLVRQALPDQELVPAASTDDIIFYREVPDLPLRALPQMGQAATEVYTRFLACDQLTPHSRTDVTAWLAGADDVPTTLNPLR